MFLAGFMTAFKQGQDGTILTLLESWHQTCKKHINVEYTAENS